MSDIIIYTTDDGSTKVDLQLEKGTVWLSQLKIAELFQSKISASISRLFLMMKNSMKLSTVNQQLTVQKEGERKVSRTILLYNLDALVTACAPFAVCNSGDMRPLF